MPYTTALQQKVYVTVMYYFCNALLPTLVLTKSSHLHCHLVSKHLYSDRKWMQQILFWQSTWIHPFNFVKQQSCLWCGQKIKTLRETKRSRIDSHWLDINIS